MPHSYELLNQCQEFLKQGEVDKSRSLALRRNAKEVKDAEQHLRWAALLEELNEVDEVILELNLAIRDDRQRQRLAKVLENYGRRVQKSVFQCRVDERLFLKMKKQVDKLLDPEEDSVRYYLLCRRCVSSIEVSGWGTVREEDEVVIV